MTRLVFLGIELDTVQLSLHLPDGKLRRIQRERFRVEWEEDLLKKGALVPHRPTPARMLCGEAREILLKEDDRAS